MYTVHCSAKFYGIQSSTKSNVGSKDETNVSPTRLLAVAIRKRRELFEEKEADLKLQIFHTSMIRALCKQMGEGRAKKRRQWTDEHNDSQNNTDNRDSGFEFNSPSVFPPSPSSPPSQIVPNERSEFSIYDDLLSLYYRPQSANDIVTAPADSSSIASKRRKVVECVTFNDSTSYSAMMAEFNEDFGLNQLGCPANDRIINEPPEDYSRPFIDSDPSWVFDDRIEKRA